jgi:hypothetical protein
MLEDKSLVVMLHVPASPGLPGHPGMEEACRRVREEAALCRDAGANALLLENMHDFPCIREEEMGPEIPAYLTLLAREVRRECPDLPLGIQVLFAASRVALSVAKAVGLDFVRAEGWLYAHVSDKGLLDAQAGGLFRYRREIGAESVAIFTDIQKKHASHALTSDLGIAEQAALLELHKSDGAIVTGSVTGDAPKVEDLKAVRGSTDLPLLIGSGITAGNFEDYFPLADAFIVGSSLKEGGRWDAPLEPVRLEALSKLRERLT